MWGEQRGSRAAGGRRGSWNEVDFGLLGPGVRGGDGGPRGARSRDAGAGAELAGGSAAGAAGSVLPPAEIHPPIEPRLNPFSAWESKRR